MTKVGSGYGSVVLDNIVRASVNQVKSSVLVEDRLQLKGEGVRDSPGHVQRIHQRRLEAGQGDILAISWTVTLV